LAAQSGYEELAKDLEEEPQSWLILLHDPFTSGEGQLRTFSRKKASPAGALLGRP